MITKFKIFEGYGSSTASDLADKLDSDFVEEWYDEHYNIDADEIVGMSSARNILDAFDEDEYKEDFIKDYISGYEFSELQEHELKEYINNHMTDEKEEKILELYNTNNFDDDNDINSEIEGTVSFIKTKTGKRTIIVTSIDGKVKKYKIPEDNKIAVQDGEHVVVDELLSTEKEIEYEEYMLDELSEDDLKEVIEDSSEEEECIEETINGWYEGRSGEELLEEFYGDLDKMEGPELYKIISSYVDDDQLVENWKSGEDYSYKKEQIQEEIYRNTELQRALVEKDPDNALALAELWEENDDDNTIGDEYDFQKGYIEKYVKDNTDETDDEEFVSEIKSDAVFYIHDHFGLDDDIKEEYKDYMIQVDTQKFNL